jgi:hypothetical protein
MITQKEGPPFQFNEYPRWGDFKSDLMKCLRDELQCPEFDKETQLCPPFLKRSGEAQKQHASTAQAVPSERPKPPRDGPGDVRPSLISSAGRSRAFPPFSPSNGTAPEFRYPPGFSVAGAVLFSPPPNR